MKRLPANARGFTLLEVLVAFSILALSLGILLQIFSRGNQTAMRGDDYTQALIIAQSRLARAGILEENLDVGEYSGTENDYHWTTTIRPYDTWDDLETNYHLAGREVIVEVDWSRGDKKYSVKLNTLRLIPTT